MFCPVLLQFSHRKMFYTLYVKDSSLNDTLLSTRTSTENEEGFSIKSKGGLRLLSSFCFTAVFKKENPKKLGYCAYDYTVG